MGAKTILPFRCWRRNVHRFHNNGVCGHSPNTMVRYTYHLWLLRRAVAEVPTGESGLLRWREPTVSGQLLDAASACAPLWAGSVCTC